MKIYESKLCEPRIKFCKPKNNVLGDLYLVHTIFFSRIFFSNEMSRELSKIILIYHASPKKWANQAYVSYIIRESVSHTLAKKKLMKNK
jgi:hypothetical protein